MESAILRQIFPQDIFSLQGSLFNLKKSTKPNGKCNFSTQKNRQFFFRSRDHFSAWKSRRNQSDNFRQCFSTIIFFHPGVTFQIKKVDETQWKVSFFFEREKKSTRHFLLQWSLFNFKKSTKPNGKWTFSTKICHKTWETKWKVSFFRRKIATIHVDFVRSRDHLLTSESSRNQMESVIFEEENLFFSLQGSLFKLKRRRNQMESAFFEDK